MKGLSKTKPTSLVKKAYAINSSEIESVIKSVCNCVFCMKILLFLNQPLIYFIVVMYISFVHYGEVLEIEISDVYLIGHNFSVTF